MHFFKAIFKKLSTICIFLLIVSFSASYTSFLPIFCPFSLLSPKLLCPVVFRRWRGGIFFCCGFGLFLGSFWSVFLRFSVGFQGFVCGWWFFCFGLLFLFVFRSCFSLSICLVFSRLRFYLFCCRRGGFGGIILLKCRFSAYFSPIFICNSINCDFSFYVF